MSEPVNKWNQPEAAPPPMFFGRKERDLVKQVNDELAERVVGQTVAYYPVSLEDSNYHPLYGEAVDKVTLPPIRVFAYVTVENEQTNERYGYEYQTKLTVNFNRKRLTDDQNLFVRVGDFLQYGEEFYEIVRTYNDTRYYFGQVEHKFQISADCVKARKGTFRIRGEMKKQLVLGTITTASAALPLPAPAPAVPFAPSNAEYVVLSTDANLTQERVLTAGTGITITDGGAGGSITIAAPSLAGGGGIFTTVDASNAYTTSSVTVGSAATPTHTLTIPGTMSGSGALITMGAATLGSTLNVSGAMVLVGTGSMSSINMTGTLSASSTLQAVGAAVLGNTLNVTGNTILGASASVGTTSQSGQLHISGAHSEVMLRIDGARQPAGESDGCWLILTGSRGSDGNPVVSLGIGTNDPQNALDVNGYISIGRTGGAYIMVNDDPDTYIRFGHAGADSMQFQAGGLNFLEFDENGLDIARLNPDGIDIDFQVLTLGNDYTIFAEGSTDRVGIGTQTPSHTLTVAGEMLSEGSATFEAGITYARTAVTAATYTILVTDYYVGVDSTSNTITLTLPPAATAGTGKTYLIKDEGGQSGVNTITVDGDGTETIDGNLSFPINSPYGAAFLYTDGSNWFIY
jgi:hypothetical protein